MGKYSFLRSKVALAIVGLVIGLIGGFKVANSQYRRVQTVNQLAAARAIPSLSRNAANGDSDAAHATAEVSSMIERAKSNPNDADAQMEAASQFIQIERPNEAMPFLEQANKVKPDDPRVTAGLGVANFMLGNLNEATTWLNRARSLGATEPTVTSLLIGTYIETGKNLDEADRLLKEIEGQGIDPKKIAQIRAELNAARSGKRNSASPSNGPPNPPNSGGSKTMLGHGPESSGGRQ